MIRHRLLACALALILPWSAQANPALQAVIDANLDQIERPSRQTVGPLVDQIAATGPEGLAMLQAWADRSLGLTETGQVLIMDDDAATDAVTGDAFAGADPRMLRPNSGVRGVIEAALAAGALTDPDPARRAAALQSLERGAAPDQLPLLRAALDDPDPVLAARKARLERLLTIQHDPDSAARVAAIEVLGYVERAP